MTSEIIKNTLLFLMIPVFGLIMLVVAAIMGILGFAIVFSPLLIAQNIFTVFWSMINAFVLLLVMMHIHEN